MAGAHVRQPQNVAIADPTIIKPYWDLAANGAIADRYFQSVAGAELVERHVPGARQLRLPRQRLQRRRGRSAKRATSSRRRISTPTRRSATCSRRRRCPGRGSTTGMPRWWRPRDPARRSPPTAPSRSPFYPCAMDPSDVPFDYYASTRQQPGHAEGRHRAHGDPPGDGPAPGGLVRESDRLPAGAPRQRGHAQRGRRLGDRARCRQIESSPFRDDTLVVLTYDEGGGYFNHVAPPATSTIDNQPYGMRLPFLAMGPFARANYVSHVGWSTPRSSSSSSGTGSGGDRPARHARHGREQPRERARIRRNGGRGAGELTRFVVGSVECGPAPRREDERRGCSMSAPRPPPVALSDDMRPLPRV